RRLLWSAAHAPAARGQHGSSRMSHPLPAVALRHGLRLFSLLFLLVPVLASARDDGGYRLPSPELQAIVDAPRAPALLPSPRRDLAALTRIPPLPSIAEVAQPELKLAGMRINPRTWSASRFSFASDLWLMELASGQERRIQGLPEPLRLAELEWSPDQKY